MVPQLKDLKIYNACQETGAEFVRMRIIHENKILKNGIFALRTYFNTFHHAYNSFLTN